MPSRKDIDRLQIPPAYLPNLMLIEVLQDPRRYAYRLIGTHVVTASGEDRTDRIFENVGFFEIHPVVIQEYDRVIDTGRPPHSLEPFTNFLSGATYDVDRLLLPHPSDGRVVDMIVAFFHFKMPADPHWTATGAATHVAAGCSPDGFSASSRRRDFTSDASQCNSKSTIPSMR
jgi:hypothetical protein